MRFRIIKNPGLILSLAVIACLEVDKTVLNPEFLQSTDTAYWISTIYQLLEWQSITSNVYPHCQNWGEFPIRNRLWSKARSQRQREAVSLRGVEGLPRHHSGWWRTKIEGLQLISIYRASSKGNFLKPKIWAVIRILHILSFAQEGVTSQLEVTVWFIEYFRLHPLMKSKPPGADSLEQTPWALIAKGKWPLRA